MITSRGKSLKIIVLFFIFFITLVILPTLASSEETYRFERMWATLKQHWYFFYPVGIGVDQNGYIYIADSENNRIQKLSPNGFIITKWGQCRRWGW